MWGKGALVQEKKAGGKSLGLVVVGWELERNEELEKDSDEEWEKDSVEEERKDSVGE